MWIQISACFFFIRDTFDIVFEWPFRELLRALPNNFLLSLLDPKKIPIYIKKCKPNLNLKSHYIGEIEHCFVTLMSLMDVKGATKTERTEGARYWRHLCRQFCPKRSAALSGHPNSCAMDREVPCHRASAKQSTGMAASSCVYG
jgi:hypothetical protein